MRVWCVGPEGISTLMVTTSPMVEDDDEILWWIPIGRNANFGVLLVYSGIAGIVWVLLVFGFTMWALVSAMVMIGLILVGVYVVVMYDEHGRPIVQARRDHYVESPPGYHVRQTSGDRTDYISPMVRDPGATPRGVRSNTDGPVPPPTDPPKPLGRPGPGTCPQCGGGLFIGRDHCPHCGYLVKVRE